MITTHPHKQVTHIRISHSQGSRRSAAIAGISIVLLLGMLLIQNVHTLPGQLTESSSVIRITPSGFEPATITLHAGTTITWKNMDVKPHILSSDTLLTTDGLLYSTAIFPKEEFRTTIREDSPPGEHAYVSLTDATLSGTVYIDNQETEAEEQTNPPLAPPPSPPLPQNPLVAKMRPTPPQSAAPMPIVPSSPLQKPFRNPETGFPLGISLLATCTVVLLLLRRILRSPRAQVIRP